MADDLPERPRAATPWPEEMSRCASCSPAHTGNTPALVKGTKNGPRPPPMSQGLGGSVCGEANRPSHLSLTAEAHRQMISVRWTGDCWDAGSTKTTTVFTSPRWGLLISRQRLDDTSGTSASDGSTTEDDGEVQCNLKTMTEQQRTMLRKNGKGQSEHLSTCGLLGGRTLRISRDTFCDLTREVSSREAGLLTDNCPTVCWF